MVMRTNPRLDCFGRHTSLPGLIVLETSIDKRHSLIGVA
jgi:hypothetical protein